MPDMNDRAPNQPLPYGAALMFAGLMVLAGLACIGTAAALLVQDDYDGGLVVFAAVGGLVLIGLGLVAPKLHQRHAAELRASNGVDAWAVRANARPWRNFLLGAFLALVTAGLGFYKGSLTVGWRFTAVAIAYLIVYLILLMGSRSRSGRTRTDAPGH